MGAQIGIAQRRTQDELLVLSLSAILTLIQMLLDTKALRDVQFFVQISEQVGTGIVAVHLRSAPSLGLRGRGVERMRLNQSRPRDSRDITVPRGTPMGEEISL